MVPRRRVSYLGGTLRQTVAVPMFAAGWLGGWLGGRRVAVQVVLDGAAPVVARRRYSLDTLDGTCLERPTGGAVPVQRFSLVFTLSRRDTLE